MSAEVPGVSFCNVTKNCIIFRSFSQAHWC